MNLRSFGFPGSLAVGLLACVSVPAFGQESIYIGLGVGQGEYEENTGDPLLGVISDNALAYKIIGGFDFTENFGMEITYGQTDQFGKIVTGNIPPFGELTDNAAVEVTNTTLMALGQLPLDWGVLLGGLGYFSADLDFEETLTGACCGTLTNNGSFSDDGLAGLLGIEWRFGRFGTSYGIRVEYEWFDLSGIDLSTLGVAITYRF